MSVLCSLTTKYEIFKVLIIFLKVTYDPHIKIVLSEKQRSQNTKHLPHIGRCFFS